MTLPTPSSGAQSRLLSPQKRGQPSLPHCHRGERDRLGQPRVALQSQVTSVTPALGMGRAARHSPSEENCLWRARRDCSLVRSSFTVSSMWLALSELSAGTVCCGQGGVVTITPACEPPAGDPTGGPGVSPPSPKDRHTLKSLLSARNRAQTIAQGRLCSGATPTRSDSSQPRVFHVLGGPSASRSWTGHDNCPQTSPNPISTCWWRGEGV